MRAHWPARILLPASRSFISHPMFASILLKVPVDCMDKDTRCQSWADRGQCDINPLYMLVQCADSCKSCDLKKGTQLFNDIYFSFSSFDEWDWWTLKVPPSHFGMAVMKFYVDSAFMHVILCCTCFTCCMLVALEISISFSSVFDHSIHYKATHDNITYILELNDVSALPV